MEPPPRQSSFSSDHSSADGSLYPGDNESLVYSANDSRRTSLWMQYSLINKKYEINNEVDCLCCNNKYLRHLLLKLAFVVVVGLGLLVSCLSLRYSTYSSTKLTLTGGDQLLVPISTYFNEKIKTSILKNRNVDDVMLYVLPKLPSISVNKIKYNKGIQFQVPSWTYQYWGLTLLKDTQVIISVCADLHLQFYIIKSAKKLKKWTQEILYDKYDYHASIHPQRNCDAKDNFKSHLLNVTHSDVYYILFSSSVGWRFLTQVTVVLQFNRTYYDTSKRKYSCLLSKTSCIADLGYASNDIGLIQAASNSSQPDSSFDTVDIMFSPIPRWSFYVKWYGLIYLVIVVLTILYSIWRWCVSMKHPTSSHEEKQPLIKPYRRPVSYSLRSTAGNNKQAPWMVVDRDSCSIQEREADSILDGVDSPPRRISLLSDLSVTSQESFLRQRSESTMNALISRNREYNDEQQLLDSCMTSAGVSAI